MQLLSEPIVPGLQVTCLQHSLQFEMFRAQLYTVFNLVCVGVRVHPIYDLNGVGAGLYPFCFNSILSGPNCNQFATSSFTTICNLKFVGAQLYTICKLHLVGAQLYPTCNLIVSRSSCTIFLNYILSGAQLYPMCKQLCYKTL